MSSAAQARFPACTYARASPCSSIWPCSQWRRSASRQVTCANARPYRSARSPPKANSTDLASTRPSSSAIAAISGGHLPASASASLARGASTPINRTSLPSSSASVSPSMMRATVCVGPGASPAQLVGCSLRPSAPAALPARATATQAASTMLEMPRRKRPARMLPSNAMLVVPTRRTIAAAAAASISRANNAKGRRS